MHPRTSSLWTPSSSVATFPPLGADLETDVVVIGAGITGITAALQLASAGRRVVVLEARHVASGVTAASTAHVTEAIDARYARIAKSFGREAARLVAASSRAAMDYIVARVDRHAIACDLQRVHGYLYTEDVVHRDALAAEHAAAHEAGLRVELDVDLGLPFLVAGSLRFPDQLRLQPRDYVWGLAHAAAAHGVVLYEETRVVDLEDGEPVVLVTASGARVRANAVVCATHVPLNKVFLQTKLGHYQSYVAAFKDCPIENALYWDCADPYHYLRVATVHGDPYLVVGGEDHKVGTEEHTDIVFERLLAYARARFGTDRAEFHWSAQVVESIDGLPFIGHNSASRSVHVATGFGGNGLTFGTVAGMMLADGILGIESPYAALYDATRIKPASVGALVRENQHVPHYLIGARLEGPEVSSTGEIERDQGRTMRVKGEHLAVYRDGGGALHAVSAVCPHMGCLVRFNEAERTWDCPCHGSRFTPDGTVIDGPAMTGLAPHALDEDRPVEAPPVPRPTHTTH